MSGPVILLYHRVARLETDPQLLAVTPERFADHVEVLRELATPMALGELVRAARTGKPPRNAVAVTFDDGYADNLENASPILHQHQVPATVFVATAGIDNTREFFWDDLDRIFLQPNHLPDWLHLEVGEKSVDIILHEAAWEKHEGWNVTLPDDPTARHRSYRQLCVLLHNATVDERHRALTQLNQWAGVRAQPRPTHRMMTPAQLCGLTRTGLIEVGGHTVNHPLLSSESGAVQHREMFDCKATLESILQRPVTSFSYPFGGRRDYTADSVAAVKAAGFDFACSNFPGPILPGQDMFQLPRMLVRNWSADEFRDRLTHWLGQRAPVQA
ncbi:MAG: polysaccharide deacetylase [Phycisphaerales bacterium]|nr:polysaccharide deacetylase [Phycisphaerales bacterium]